MYTEKKLTKSEFMELNVLIMFVFYKNFFLYTILYFNLGIDSLQRKHTYIRVYMSMR